MRLPKRLSRLTRVYKRRRLRRKLIVETLETRKLLAADLTSAMSESMEDSVPPLVSGVDLSNDGCCRCWMLCW